VLAALGGPARDILRGALAREPLSARAMGRILRVARTIADLEGCAHVEEPHVAEALQFRRIVWET
jgi:magnesium chelatase family protein